MELCVSAKRKSLNYNKKRKAHLLQKLYQREIQGSYGAFGRASNQPLFSRLPIRLAFNLRELVPESALIAGHVFMGLSRCGQFLMSYTHTVEPDHSLNMVYKYRLHWWTFVPSQRSRKVAEVTLFSDAGVGHNVFISISQWPLDTKHVLIYGCSDDPYERSLTQSAHCYLTITTVPSMHNCPDCLKVAASYEDEDLAASWDSCVRFSCLRHGLTVHTTFDVVPPFPKFEPRISMRHEGTVVLNTGNFLHALHVRLENVPGAGSVGGGPQASYWSGGTSHKNESETETTGTDGQEDDEETEEEEDGGALEVETGGICKRPNTRPSQQTRTQCPKPYLTAPMRIKDCTDGDESKVRCRSSSARRARLGEMVRRWCRPDEVEVEWACWSSWEGRDESNGEESTIGGRTSVKMGWVERWGCGEEAELGGRREVSDLGDARRELSITCGDTPAPPVTYLSYPSTGDESMGGGVRSRRMAAERAYEFTDEADSWGGGGACEKLSVFRRRRLADKKYEFCDDEDAENVVPFWVMRSSSARGELNGGRGCGGGRAPSPATPRTAASPTPPPPVAAAASPPHAHLPPVQELAGPGGGETASQIVLRPLNRNTTATVTNVHHVREGGGLGVGERKSNPQTVVRVGNPLSQLGLLPCGATAPTTTSSAPAQATTQNNGQSTISPSTGCSVQYKRWYLEVDDELISVITDIEDDDLSSSTGYHSALPLDIHGSGYAQMQMVSSSKVEKLRAPSVLVHQMSLDVEQFCHEVAQKLCADAGKKYWFCNDYDVEIVAVCPISGDVIAVAAMLIQAAVKTKGLAKSQRYPVSSVQRSKYQTSVRFVWNLDTGRYQVVDTDELREVPETEGSGGAARDSSDISEGEVWSDGGNEVVKPNFEGPRWHPARTDSLQLRHLIPPPLSQPGVRTLSNQSELRGISLKKILDVDNMVALVFIDND